MILNLMVFDGDFRFDYWLEKESKGQEEFGFLI